MTRTSVDSSTGDLLVGGRRLFPLGLSDPPPVGGVAPNGADAWAEVASAGVTFVRNYTVWTAAGAAEQLASVAQELDAAAKHGLQVWVALAGIDDDLSRQSLLTRVVDTLKGHPGLGAWKGTDEPAHAHVPAAGCVAVYRHLRSIDPDHPVAQARFMAYDAIVAGARGLFFFGGQVKQAMNLADRQLGWNWTYWKNVQRPLLEELGGVEHATALTAPASGHAITASAADIALSARQAGGFLYLIAVRRSPTLAGTVRFSGLPAGIKHGTVLAHPGGNPARQLTASGGAFSDPSPFAPHNARVYRFPLTP